MSRVHPVAPLLGGIPNASSVMGLLNAWDSVHPRLTRLPVKYARRQAAWRSRVARAGALSRRILLRRRELLGPSAGDGRDRQAHHRQGGVDDKAAEPWFFLKTTAGSIIGPAPVRLPVSPNRSTGKPNSASSSAADPQHFRTRRSTPSPAISSSTICPRAI